MRAASTLISALRLSGRASVRASAPGHVGSRHEQRPHPGAAPVPEGHVPRGSAAQEPEPGCAALSGGQISG